MCHIITGWACKIHNFIITPNKKGFSNPIRLHNKKIFMEILFFLNLKVDFKPKQSEIYNKKVNRSKRRTEKMNFKPQTCPARKVNKDFELL